MSKEKLLSGCSEAVIAKWLADFAAECAEMRRLTRAPEPPGTFLTFEQLWTQKQETIKSARLCWGTDGRLIGVQA